MSALVACVYRKPKPGHNGDGVRRVGRVILCFQPGEPDARLASPYSVTSVF